MSLVQDRCICLRKVEYSETSQILTLFGRTHGIVKVIARGAHRRTKAGASKFDGGLDLLDVGEAVFTHHPERDLATLTEWRLREGHPELRRSLRGLYLSFYAAELIGFLFEEHDPHPVLFDALERSLLEFPSSRVEQTFLAFEVSLLRESGYLPELSACGSCGVAVAERGPTAFDLAHGSIVCRRCEGAFPQRLSFDGRLLPIIQQFIQLPQRAGTNGSRLPALTRYQTDPINRLLADHIEHTLGRRLRMPRWVIASRRAAISREPVRNS